MANSLSDDTPTYGCPQMATWTDPQMCSRPETAETVLGVETGTACSRPCMGPYGSIRVHTGPYGPMALIIQ